MQNYILFIAKLKRINMMNKNNYKIQIINKLNNSFIDEWRSLWKTSENANIYNSYEWFLTCLETKTVKEYEMYACYKNNKLVALLPLQEYRVFGVKFWGTLDKEHQADTAFLMETYDGSLMKFFFEKVFANKNIYLQKVDSKASNLLHDNFPELFIYLMSVNPSIDLTKDPFEYVSSSNRYQIRKLLRDNEGKIVYKMYSSDLDKHLNELFALQKKSSKNERSIDIFEKETTKKYYQSLIKNCKYFIRINFLYFDKTPFAYELGFLYGKHYVGDQISYLHAYKKLSPGRLLMYSLFNYLKTEGIKDIDMGGGISSYKMSFAKDYRILYNVIYVKNRSVLFWLKTINKLRRAKQVFFPKKFTRDHEFLFKTYEL